LSPFKFRGRAVYTLVLNPLGHGNGQLSNPPPIMTISIRSGLVPGSSKSAPNQPWAVFAGKLGYDPRPGAILREKNL
jgi:hypothetical protein